MSNEFYHDERDTRIEAEALQAQEPVVWFAFADNNGPVPLELWGFDERACKHAVLENARSVGWKGTVEGYMLHMGWTIRPLTTAPQPPAPCQKCAESERIEALATAKLGDEIIKNGSLQDKLAQLECDFALEHDDKLELQAKVAEQSALIEKCERGLSDVESLVDESKGVTGLHLNGDVALWTELREGGNNEGWLIEFDEALAAIAAQKGGAK